VAFIKSLQGKEIGIVGKVKLHKGKPEIVITEKEQIKVAEWSPIKCHHVWLNSSSPRAGALLRPLPHRRKPKTP
jgi:hypothetical protein